MSITHYTGTFNLTDGRTLKVEYSIRYTPASYWEPSDSDVSEPTIEIDGEEVSYDQLPKGLSAIVDDLCENDPPKLGGTLQQSDGNVPDYDPDPDDFICDRFYDGN